MKYSKWFRYNEERLQVEYDEYFESIDKNFEIPLSFEDYCFDKYEESQNSYYEREERE